MIEILMPALSPTMTHGTLLKWLKAQGDLIKSGDILAEIETDKATMEVEAVDEGILGRILVPAGTSDVAINTPIGLIGEKEEDFENYQPKDLSPTEKKSEPLAPSSSLSESTFTPATTAAPIPSSSERIFASPLAKRIARDKEIDLSKIQGSGPYGRIIRADVENASVLSSQPSVTIPTGPGSFTDLPLSSMRKVIANRLLESKQTVPHFYVTTAVEMDALMETRAQLNKAFDTKVTVNDFIIKAVASSMIAVPMINRSWTGNAIRQFHQADISVAVAIEEGLITPIVFGANQKSLFEISTEVKELVTLAKAGKLKPTQFQGGTFSISNLGMFGVEEFDAIINPPQACILAVGAALPQAIVRNGALQAGLVMRLTLSVDHRVIDGATAAQFLQALKVRLESPAVGLV